MTISRAVAFALLANLMFAVSGCGAFGSEEASSDNPQPEPAPGEGPKAPPVGGPADNSELTDALGIFVAPDGNPAADGTHAHPVASIQVGIDIAKRVGK